MEGTRTPRQFITDESKKKKKKKKKSKAKKKHKGERSRGKTCDDPVSVGGHRGCAAAAARNPGDGGSDYSGSRPSASRRQRGRDAGVVATRDSPRPSFVLFQEEMSENSRRS